MTKTFYLDTCIWRDFYEGRFGQRGKPLGKYASLFFIKIMKSNNKILFSDVNHNELRQAFSIKDINNMLQLLFIIGILGKVESTKEDALEANYIRKKRSIPFGDALHAVIARKNNAIMVSRDKHFLELTDIVEVKKPEELI